nr:RNA-dependent RNA polymerase [Picobirnavirus sp.]
MKEDIQTPFFKGISTPALLEKWDKCLRSTGIQDTYPRMYSFDYDLGKKVGPMSLIRPFSERMADVEAYYTLVQVPSKPLDSNAMDALLEMFRKKRGIRTKSQKAVWEDLDSKSRSAGAPTMLKKKLAIRDTLPAVVSGTDHLDTPKWHGQTCAVLFARGQEGGFSTNFAEQMALVKNRVVWGTPLGEILEEGQFYQPKIAAKKTMAEFPHLRGDADVDERVTLLFDSKPLKDLVVCTDFDKYDQHYNKAMQGVAKTLDAWLLGGDDHPFIQNVFDFKFNVPIVCTEDTMFVGPHGMASGSYGTNDDETDTHTGLQLETAIRNGQELNEYSQRNGDDGMLTYPGIKVKQVVDCYTSHGMEMNLAKQYASADDCVYLRRYHAMDYRVDGVCVGVYSTFRALGRLRYQERYYDPDEWGPKMVTLRAWSIIENCKWHPAFKPFVDFVCDKGDKFRLGLDLPGFLDDIEHIALQAMDNFTDFLGFNKTQGKDAKQIAKGIKSWEIYKYLAEKAKR